MGISSDLLNRAQRALQTSTPTALDWVPADAFDRAVMDGIISESKPVNEYREKLSEEYFGATELVRDLGSLCFQPSPQIRDLGTADPRVNPSRALVQAAHDAPEMEDLRKYTVYDRWATAAALQTLQTVLEPLIEKAKEEQKHEEEREQQRQETKDGLENAIKCGNGPLTEQLVEVLEGLGRDSQQAAEDLRAGASKKIADSVSQAAQQAEKGNNETRGWGIEPGELQKMDFEERAKLAEAMSKNRMSKYLDLIGRMRMAAFSENARQSEHGRDEAYSVTIGRNPADFLPAELMALTHPTLRTLTLPRLAEGRMLSRKWRGIQKEGKGPIVVCLDTSGSMHGEPEAWSKAFALALMELARKNGRTFAAILFSDAKSLKLVKGTSREAMFEVGSTFFGGGTSWETPLAAGVELIEREASLHKADLILVTDGIADVRHKWLKTYDADRERLGIRAWGVWVDSDGWGTDLAPLARVCDDVRSISSMTDTAKVGDLFRAA